MRVRPDRKELARFAKKHPLAYALCSMPVLAVVAIGVDLSLVIGAALVIVGPAVLWFVFRAWALTPEELEEPIDFGAALSAFAIGAAVLIVWTLVVLS